MPGFSPALFPGVILSEAKDLNHLFFATSNCERL
jgi:hypothetical protein